MRNKAIVATVVFAAALLAGAGVARPHEGEMSRDDASGWGSRHAAEEYSAETAAPDEGSFEYREALETGMLPQRGGDIRSGFDPVAGGSDIVESSGSWFRLDVDTGP